MPAVKFSKEFLTSRSRLAPNWYKLRVGTWTEETSKAGDSMNWVGSFTVDDGPDKGTVIKHWFNEKANGRVTDYLLVFTNGDMKKLEEIATGKDVVDLLNQTAGREISGFAKYDMERKWNTIEDFKPVGGK